MPERAPFDPTDPVELMSEQFRVDISDVAMKAFEKPAYLDLSSPDQLASFLCGGLTGLVGCCFAHVTPEGRDAVMAEIARYLPLARQQAESIADAVALDPAPGLSNHKH